MAFSSAVDGATEDCDAAGAGRVGRRAVPSQAGLSKGSEVAMVISLVWRGGWWFLECAGCARAAVCTSIRISCAYYRRYRCCESAGIRYRDKAGMNIRERERA